MEEIKDKDAAKLVSLIYGTTMYRNWGEADSNKLSDIVTIMKDSVSKSPDNKLGGEMIKEEFLDEIKEFTNNDKTDFGAMTLIDPQNKVKPTIIFRGTAGVSSQIPSQKEVASYVINSGLDHVILAGHSEGGNMAAYCSYFLPEGMVDRVYSYDGQGESQ